MAEIPIGLLTVRDEDQFLRGSQEGTRISPYVLEFDDYQVADLAATVLTGVAHWHLPDSGEELKVDIIERNEADKAAATLAFLGVMKSGERMRVGALEARRVSLIVRANEVLEGVESGLRLQVMPTLAVLALEGALVEEIGRGQP